MTETEDLPSKTALELSMPAIELENACKESYDDVE